MKIATSTQIKHIVGRTMINFQWKFSWNCDIERHIEGGTQVQEARYGERYETSSVKIIINGVQTIEK